MRIKQMIKSYKENMERKDKERTSRERKSLDNEISKYKEMKEEREVNLEKRRELSILKKEVSDMKKENFNSSIIGGLMKNMSKNVQNISQNTQNMTKDVQEPGSKGKTNSMNAFGLNFGALNSAFEQPASKKGRKK